MHESLRLYDASLGVLAEEVKALAEEDEERALELFEKRAALMDEAWEKRAGCGAHLLLDRLEAIKKAQMALEAKASSVMEELRVALKDSRKENTRLAGYGKVVNHRQSALIVSKEG